MDTSDSTDGTHGPTPLDPAHAHSPPGSAAGRTPRRSTQGPSDPPAAAEKSFGNMGPHHWSRTREGENAEAMEYYRERSRAPGVAAGGTERNFYCMSCAGVIPHDPPATACPHCGEDLTGVAKRYFNWVEINEPPASDARALIPIALAGVAVLALVGFGLYWWSRS